MGPGSEGTELTGFPKTGEEGVYASLDYLVLETELEAF